MHSGRNSNMWFSFLLSKGILPRGGKQRTCFSSYLTKPKTILDVDPYMEIYSLQNNSQGLALFLFQLGIWPGWARGNIGSILIPQKNLEAFLAPSPGKDSAWRTNTTSSSEEWRAVVTACLRTTDTIFSCGCSVKKNTKGRKCLKCLKEKKKSHKVQF